MKVALWMRLEKVMRAAGDLSLDRMTECFNMSESTGTALPDLVAPLLVISPSSVTLEHGRPVEQEEDCVCPCECVSSEMGAISSVNRLPSPGGVHTAEK